MSTWSRIDINRVCLGKIQVLIIYETIECTLCEHSIVMNKSAASQQEPFPTYSFHCHLSRI